MTARALFKDLGAFVDVFAGAGITPAANFTAGTVNGTGIEVHGRNGGRDYSSAILGIDVDSITGGTPTIEVQLEESSDNSNWTDYTTVTATLTVSAVGRAQLSIDLESSDRYVRVARITAGAGTVVADVSLALFRRGEG